MSLEFDTIQKFRAILRQLEREIGWQLKSETQCCGVTVGQCHIILEIGGNKECSLVDLAESLKLDPSTLSRTVNNLVDSGLVQRITSEHDRRYITLSLTTEGEAVYASINTRCNQSYEFILSMIPEEKHQQIIESFTLFTEALAKYRGFDE